MTLHHQSESRPEFEKKTETKQEDSPPRPPSLPTETFWSHEYHEWVQGSFDENGQQQGIFHYYRKDGTLCNECFFKNGIPDGPFLRFHENGAISNQGRFVHGRIHGTRIWIACSDETTESQPVPGVPSIWRAEVDYEDGYILAFRYFDKQGQPLNLDGSKLPLRPISVSPRALFHPRSKMWVEGRWDEQGLRQGFFQFWDQNGMLERQTSFLEDQEHGIRLQFGKEGQLVEEWSFIQGKRQNINNTDNSST